MCSVGVLTLVGMLLPALKAQGKTRAQSRILLTENKANRISLRIGLTEIKANRRSFKVLLNAKGKCFQAKNETTASKQ